MERLQVYIPATAEAYKRKSGELCFFLVSEDVKAAYDKEARGGNYTAILDEQPLFYDDLKPGQELPIKLQGTNSPIVPYEALKHYASLCDKIKGLAEDPKEQG